MTKRHFFQICKCCKMGNLQTRTKPQKLRIRDHDKTGNIPDLQTTRDTMKKTIGGIRYDTGKALLIGKADNLGDGARTRTVMTFWEAWLYVSRKSEHYFLFGRGGSMSRFGQAAGRNTFGGAGMFSDLIPLSKGEAYQWCYMYLGADIAKSHFEESGKNEG